jgi:hypothetical protein
LFHSFGERLIFCEGLSKLCKSFVWNKLKKKNKNSFIWDKNTKVVMFFRKQFFASHTFAKKNFLSQGGGGGVGFIKFV